MTLKTGLALARYLKGVIRTGQLALLDRVIRELEVLAAWERRPREKKTQLELTLPLPPRPCCPRHPDFKGFQPTSRDCAACREVHAEAHLWKAMDLGPRGRKRKKGAGRGRVKRRRVEVDADW